MMLGATTPSMFMICHGSNSQLHVLAATKLVNNRTACKILRDIRNSKQSSELSAILNFRRRGFCILGQAFHYSPQNAFYIFNQQIYFNVSYLFERASLI